jgi:TolB-like protein
MMNRDQEPRRQPRRDASGILVAAAGDPAAAFAQLERILRSPGFVSSPQLCRLLRFLLQETLAGRGDSLLQYRIGTEALGQPAGFDPETNAVVRVTGGRLRAKLKHYYETLGLQDPCLISLPRSGYQLMISFSRHPARRAEPPPPSDGLPVVGVLEFRGLGLPGKWQHLPVCLSEELAMLIARAGPVRLRGPFSRRRLIEEEVEPSDLGKNYAVDYILDGSVEDRGGVILIRVRLLDGAGGVQLWSRKYQCESDHWNLGRIETEILQAIATELGADFGRIERHLIGLASLRPEGSLTVHEAILKAKAYEVDLSEKSFRAGVAALERAMLLAPHNALLHATLSVLLFFGYLEYFSIGENFPVRATALAKRALQLDPLGAWPRFSEVTAAFMLRKHGEFATLSTQLCEDPGFPLGLSGMLAQLRICGRVEVDASVKVIRLLQQQNPHYPRILHFGLCLRYFGAHRYEAALIELDLFDMPGDPGDPLLRCAILFRQTRTAEACDQYRRLVDDFPGFLENAPVLLARYLHPDYTTAILRAVGLAGEQTGSCQRSLASGLPIV